MFKKLGVWHERSFQNNNDQTMGVIYSYLYFDHDC